MCPPEVNDRFCESLCLTCGTLYIKCYNLPHLILLIKNGRKTEATKRICMSTVQFQQAGRICYKVDGQIFVGAMHQIKGDRRQIQEIFNKLIVELIN